MKKTRTHAEIISRLDSVHNGNIVMLDDYTRWDQRPRLECKVCGNLWSSRLDSILGGVGCPKCAVQRVVRKRESSRLYQEFRRKQSERYLRPLEDHQRDLDKRHDGRLTIMWRMAHDNQRAWFSCNVCSHSWEARIDSVKRLSRGCPRCGLVEMASKLTKPEEERKLSDPDYRKLWYTIANLSHRVFRKYRGIIDPNNKWGTGFELDHMYSIHDYVYNPLNLKKRLNITEVCHPANFQILSQKENLAKRHRSWITATSLRRYIKEWNKQHGNPFRRVDGRLMVV